MLLERIPPYRYCLHGNITSKRRKEFTLLNKRSRQQQQTTYTTRQAKLRSQISAFFPIVITFRCNQYRNVRFEMTATERKLLFTVDKSSQKEPDKCDINKATQLESSNGCKQSDPFSNTLRPPTSRTVHLHSMNCTTTRHKNPIKPVMSHGKRRKQFETTQNDGNALDSDAFSMELRAKNAIKIRRVYKWRPKAIKASDHFGQL